MKDLQLPATRISALQSFFSLSGRMIVKEQTRLIVSHSLLTCVVVAFSPFIFSQCSVGDVV